MQSPSSASARSAAGAWVRNNKGVVLVTALSWLLVLRLIVPGFFNYSAKEEELIAEGGLPNQIIWLSLLIVPLFVLRARGSLTWQFLRSLNRFFLLLFFYVCASTLWSIDSGATLRKLFHLFTIFAVSLAVGVAGWHPKRFQTALRPIVTIMLVGSLIFGVIRPDMAISLPNLALGETAVYWRGLTEHKNALGALASLGVLFWYHALLHRESKALTALVGILAGITCIVLSRSSTALLASMFAIVLMLIIHWTPRAQRRYMPYLIVLFAIVIVVYALAILKVVPGMDVLISPITSATGKEATFTGRTAIWDLVKEHIKLSPIVGSGYGGFWVGPFDYSPSYAFVKKLYFYPFEAHNGYLDIINDLGYVGLALLGAFLSAYAALSIRLLKIDRPQAALYLAILFDQLLANLAETSWLQVDLSGMILLFAAIDLSRALLEQKFHQTIGAPRTPVRKPSRRMSARGRLQTRMPRP
jgi:exopolysaccharide production protein ExoQ